MNRLSLLVPIAALVSGPIAAFAQSSGPEPASDRVVRVGFDADGTPPVRAPEGGPPPAAKGAEGRSSPSWLVAHAQGRNCTACHQAGPAFAATTDPVTRLRVTQDSWHTVLNPSESSLATKPYGYVERFYPSSASDDLGVQLTAADGAVRAQLNLPDGQGLVVTGLAEGGRAAAAGIRPNDILLTLADAPLHAAGDVIVQLKQASLRPGHAEDSVPLGLLRGGKPLTIQVKPEVRVALGAVVEEKPDFYIGTPANPVDATLRAHLDLPADTGLVLGEIAEGSPSAKAGIEPNDILLSFDGQPVPDVETLRARIQATGGKPAKVRLLRAGKPVEATVTPEKRPSHPESTLAADTYVLGYLSGENVTGPLLLQPSPNTARTFMYDPYWPYTNANPGAPAPTDLAKKIDDLNARIAELTKAVEELRKAPK